ncbi:S-layer homology domain-containing protein [Kocuria sp.]|uniref:CAP and S-layer homology domain-containing protein n=1 Tax=Kocuria sp. TaxID=1871328 RepID=UPI0026DFB5C1|nr:S-layer homology domain-containing protein [Kocuria sp.]MDO5619062.1 S-layer homology domain-containing protein [Kocuria sp.]
MRKTQRFLAGAALVAAVSTTLPLAISAPAHAAQQDIVNASQATLDGHRQTILQEINKYRASRGLAPVKYSPTLTGISQDESNRVVRDENFNHSNNFLRDSRFNGATTKREITALEYSVNPVALVNWWKNSPSHNAVLLDPRVTVVGIGVTLADGSLTRTGQPWRIVSVVNGGGYANGGQPADTRNSVTGSSTTTTTQQSTNTTTVRPQAVPGPFADVAGNQQHAAAISWVKTRGVLTGWPDGTFRPHQAIDRDAMAAVAYRMAGSPRYTPPAQSPYTDVSPQHPFYKEITWANSRGLLTGWPDGSFRPNSDITRDATAALFHRMAGSPASGASSSFVDVRAGQPHSEAIAWMASTGVAQGWSDGTYRPTASTNRDAMAAFIYRYAN